MRVFDVVKKLQDLTSLSWDEKTVTSGTGGTFLKARAQTARGDIYYKLSCYDRFKGIYGHESVNEVIASRLLNKLNIPHVPYRLIHAEVNIDGRAHETWLSESRDYRSSHERRQALDTFCELNAGSYDSPMDICKAHGWQDDIHRMMAFDYLIANRDRHGANIEVLFRDSSISLAPLFDHGVSLIYSCYDDERRARDFDALYDIQANNYLGGRSLEDNLQFLPQGVFAAHQLDDLSWVLEGLDRALPETHRKKIIEMIALRWRHLIELSIASGNRR